MRLLREYAAAQAAVDAAAPKEPTNDEYWARDDAGVAVTDQLAGMLAAGWTLTPPPKADE